MVLDHTATLISLLLDFVYYTPRTLDFIQSLNPTEIKQDTACLAPCASSFLCLDYSPSYTLHD